MSFVESRPSHHTTCNSVILVGSVTAVDQFKKKVVMLCSVICIRRAYEARGKVVGRFTGQSSVACFCEV